ncbi:hypothetical protein TRVL_10141 [Trypanosoma vivax]|nr:hypothetical protein TRVL_10141 [Trypanosoma vivax]
MPRLEARGSAGRLRGWIYKHGFSTHEEAEAAPLAWTVAWKVDIFGGEAGAACKVAPKRSETEDKHTEEGMTRQEMGNEQKNAKLEGRVYSVHVIAAARYLRRN